MRAQIIGVRDAHQLDGRQESLLDLIEVITLNRFHELIAGGSELLKSQILLLTLLGTVRR
jgi:hypothetical protein